MKKIRVVTEGLHGHQQPLYHPTKTQAPVAFIYMKTTGEVGADYVKRDNFTTMSAQLNGELFRWYIPAAIDGETLAQFLKDPDTILLMESVLNGVERHKHERCFLSADAYVASLQLETRLGGFYSNELRCEPAEESEPAP